mgnify:FL=1|tara:strand:+ start:191239 stop:191721 length:483 start_codon:yes stop_codon:yes gene_type:complete
MIVYLIRHGQAEDLSESGHDADRVLVHKGHEQAAAIAEFLSDPGQSPPTIVLASPYTRTTQTATPIWNALGQPVQHEPRIAADRFAEDIMSVIEESDAPSLALVSHNPLVGRAADILVAGPSAPRLHSMRPGQLYGFKVDRENPIGSAQLVAEFRMDDAF